MATTTIPDPDVERAKDLIQRHFGPCTELDRRYVGDITYISTWEGWAYLATVIDLASRKVVGWALADHMRTDLVTDALDAAFSTRQPPPGAIFHSDRGCQYTSGTTPGSPAPTASSCPSAVPASAGITPSPSRSSRRSSGAHRHPRLADPGRAARRELRRIEGWYNTRRLHSSLGYLSPTQYEATIHHPSAAQAA